MATKLKNLKIRKVDFVDEGANPDAHIETNGGNGPGFLKRLLGFAGKTAESDQKGTGSVAGGVKKDGSASFNDKISEVQNRKVCDEIWDVCYALQESLYSILRDEGADGTSKETAMKESLGDFTAFMQESIESWSSGKAVNIVKMSGGMTNVDVELMEFVVGRLREEIEKAGKSIGKPEDEKDAEDGPDNSNPKGEEEEMKIDKSKLTDAERAFLDSIEKRYGAEEGTDGGEKNTDPQAHVVEPTAKSAIHAAEEPAEQDNGEDGIYKGLHPAVKEELEALKKFKDAAEDRELNQIAEKYAIIGKKKEELVPLFKSLRSAGGTAYDDMIAVLDQAVDVVEKSGAFKEVGKSGHGASAVNAAEQKIDTIAKGYMEKDATLDYTTAVAKAWENNPELMDEYEGG